VIISSRVEAAIGRAVRIDVSELFADEEGYRLGPEALDCGRRYGLFICERPFKSDSVVLFVEGGK
jgi:hypothetical protein